MNRSEASANAALADQKIRQIIRKHYELSRPVTDAEMQEELANIKRRKEAGTLDDSYELLAAKLERWMQ